MRPKLPDHETAAEIALNGLAFLAADSERLTLFMTLTGIDVGALKADAGEAHMMAAVLEYLAADESLLLVFTANAGIDPELIAPALHVLQHASSSSGC